MFESTFPILSTPDLTRALGFYCGLLDGAVTFRFPEEGDPAFVTVEIGPSTIGLGHDPSVGEQDGPSRFALWVYAASCDAAVERLRAGGVTIVEEPADQPWGERVARVRDPDGNTVVIGSSEPLA